MVISTHASKVVGNQGIHKRLKERERRKVLKRIAQLKLGATEHRYWGTGVNNPLNGTPRRSMQYAVTSIKIMPNWDRRVDGARTLFPPHFSLEPALGPRDPIFLPPKPFHPLSEDGTGIPIPKYLGGRSVRRTTMCYLSSPPFKLLKNVFYLSRQYRAPIRDAKNTNIPSRPIHCTK